MHYKFRGSHLATPLDDDDVVASMAMHGHGHGHPSQFHPGFPSPSPNGISIPNSGCLAGWLSSDLAAK